jgi:hypothetical protein
MNLFKEKIDNIEYKIGLSSYLILVAFNIIYFAALIGIVLINTSYINAFNILIHSILCLFLMIRFNPMRKNIEINKYDQVIIFSSALFLLINLGIIEVIKTFYVNGESTLKKGIQKLINM